MSNVLPQNPAKVLTMVALLAAMLFGAGYASAGTQWPPWRLRQLQQSQASVQLPAPAITQSAPEHDIVVVDEVDPPANDNGGQTGGEGSAWEVLGGGNGNDGQGVAPVSAPSPSALLAGLGMIGLLAGRRQRKNDD